VARINQLADTQGYSEAMRLRRKPELLMSRLKAFVCACVCVYYPPGENRAG
jgi:hypothetical protein